MTSRRNEFPRVDPLGYLALARRLASEGKIPAGLEKIVREELKPLSRNLPSELQERLVAEGVSAARDWWREHGGRGKG